MTWLMLFGFSSSLLSIPGKAAATLLNNYKMVKAHELVNSSNITDTCAFAFAFAKGRKDSRTQKEISLYTECEKGQQGLHLKHSNKNKNN